MNGPSKCHCRQWLRFRLRLRLQLQNWLTAQPNELGNSSSSAVPPYAIAVSKCVYSTATPLRLSHSLFHSPSPPFHSFSTFYLIWFYGPARSWESGKCGYATPILIKIELRLCIVCKLRMDNYSKKFSHHTPLHFGEMLEACSLENPLIFIW